MLQRFVRQLMTTALTDTRNMHRCSYETGAQMEPDTDLSFLLDQMSLFLSHLEASLSHPLLNFLVYLTRTFHCLDLHHLVFLLEVVHNWHARLHERLEPLLDALGIIVSAATGLSPVDETLGHDVFGAVEKEDKFRGADGFFKADGLIHFAGEACALISCRSFVTSCRLNGMPKVYTHRRSGIVPFPFPDPS